MKHVRSIACFLCFLFILARWPVYAAETEPEAVPSVIHETTAPESESVRESEGPPENGSAAEAGGTPESESARESERPLENGSAPETGGTPESESTRNPEGLPESEGLQDSGYETDEDAPDPDTDSESEPEEEDDVDPIFGLRVGEEITISMSDLCAGEGELLAAAASAQVKIKVLAKYSYDDVGLGNGGGMYTNKYKVTYNGASAIAYCLNPAKANPKESDHFSIQRIEDGKKLAKLLYYARADVAGNGYFALKHPGYSDAKQFIITHIAASKVNGSSSWDKNVSAKGISEANALISYAASMPAIRDPKIAFSPASVDAVLNGDVLQTGSVTLVADTGNTAAVTLPAGVYLNNQTAPERSGSGGVTLAAGDVFSLEYHSPAICNLAVTVSAAGILTRDYNAYKIFTDTDTQNLGLIFADAITDENQASLTARFTPDVTVYARKVDSDTEHGLQGAVFGLYAQQDMTEADGAVRKQDELIESAVTDAEGKAQFAHKLTVGLPYYVKEDQAPAGYQLNTRDRMPVLFNMPSGSGVPQTMEQVFKNDVVKGRIRLVKTDSLKGTQPQGDAVLSGAVYGLYAREDICSPDQSGQILYHAGELVREGETDEDASILWEDLPLGKYYVKEISPSEGYTLDDTEYETELVCVDADNPVVSADLTVTEEVIRQAFSLKKLSDGGAEPIPLAGAGFKVWLVSSLKKEGEEYDLSGAEPVVLCEDGSTELFTDEKGMAVSAPLPYGTYLVRETTVPQDHLPVEDIMINIRENSPDEPLPVEELTDCKVRGQIRLLKRGPVLTGYSGQKFLYETRGLAGAIFEVKAAQDIFRTDSEGYENGPQTVLYENGQTVAVLTTDSSGVAISQELPLGSYTVRETTAPYGTVLVDKTYEVQLAGDGESQLVIEDLEIEDPRQKVAVRITKCSGKTGNTPLGGAEFTLYAKEDIHARSEDGKARGRLLVRAGTALARAVSGRDGQLTFDLDLPHGRYYVQESRAPEGYLLDKQKYDCDCSYGDQNKENIEISLKIHNEPLKETASGSAPRTGDPARPGIFFLLLIAALAVIAFGIGKLLRVSQEGGRSDSK